MLNSKLYINEDTEQTFNIIIFNCPIWKYKKKYLSDFIINFKILLMFSFCGYSFKITQEMHSHCVGKIFYILYFFFYYIL